MMCIRLPLSLRNVEDLFHARGINVSHEAVRYWWHRFGPLFAVEIKKPRIEGMKSSSWRCRLAEMFVKINGERCFLWRAVDRDGEDKLKIAGLVVCRYYVGGKSNRWLGITKSVPRALKNVLS